MAPEGGWGWMVVLGSAIVHVVCTGLQFSFGVIYLDLVDRFSSGATEASLVLIIFNLIHFCFGPLASSLANKYGCRGVVITGSLIMMAGCVASAFAPNLYALYLTLGVLTGFGSSLTLAPSMVIVSHYFVKRRSKAMALSTFGSSISCIGMAPFLLWILDTYSFPGAALMYAGLSFNLCVAGALYRPLQTLYFTGNVDTIEKNIVNGTSGNGYIHSDSLILHSDLPNNNEFELKALKTKQTSHLIHKGEPETDEMTSPIRVEDTKGTSGILSSIFKKFPRPKNQVAVLKNPSFIIYVLTIFSMPINNMCFYTFLPALLNKKGATEAEVAIIFIIAGAFDIIGRFSFGFLFDLKLVKKYRVLLQGTAGVITGLVTLVTPHVTSHVWITIMCCLRTLVMSGFNAQRVTVMADLIPVHQVAAGVGIVLFSQGIGSVAFIVAGVLKDTLQSLNMPFYYGGLSMALLCLLFVCHQGIKFIKSDTTKQSEQVLQEGKTT